MFVLNGIQTQYVKISVKSLQDIVKAISKEYFKTEDFNSLVLKDEYICIEYDTSYHGSPIYEYRQITNNKELIKVYEALKILYNFNEKEFTN